MADETKAELIRELDRARHQAGTSRRALAADLRIGPMIRRSIERNKAAWIGGAIVFGLLISRLTVRTKKVVVAATKGSRVERELKTAGMVGALIPILKIAFDLAKPALTKLATQWITDLSANRRS